MKQFLYLSYALANNTPIYGGNPKIEIHKVKSIANGDSSNTELIKFLNHSGTHVDFPYHFDNKGKTLNDYGPFFWFFCKPYLLEISATENQIIDLNNELNLIPDNVDFLLIKTGFGKFRKNDIYWRNNPGLSADLATRLRNRFSNLKAIGVDFISISAYQHREIGRTAHYKFLIENDFLLVEDMNLEFLHEQPDKVFCFPLLVEKSSGTPVSVIAELP